MEYTSRLYSDLVDGRRRDLFESALADVTEANVSSHSFNEDSFAGLKNAIESMSWGPYPSRIIMLVTDAGPVSNDDPYSTTRMRAAEVADMAGAKGIKIFALHLKTALGAENRANNHAYAERQYRILTGQADATLGDLYVPIDASETASGVREFGRVVEGVARQMVELVWATGAGKRLTLPESQDKAETGAAAVAQRKAAILGYAMQLEFLGKVKRM